MNENNFDSFILSNMPHFIAVNYQRLLITQTAQERVKLALHIYNLGLRTLTIGLVSQYLIRDKDRVIDSYLNELLLQKFPHLTLDAWQQLLFAALQAYEGNRDLFFIPELYDFCWDTSVMPHKRRAEIEQPFARLTQIGLEIQTKLVLPQTEVEWQKLAEETTDLLQQFLNCMAFIGQYDLIRIIDYDEQFYEFEVHKEFEISSGRRPIPRNVELSQGWFYLRKETEEFLLLHPLLISWVEESGINRLASSDTGIYDRFVQDQLQYLLAALGRTIIQNQSVQAFVALLFETIEEVKHKRQEARRLTWWQLRDICTDITQHRMATVRGKYHRELYLPRDKTHQAFKEFLQSDKRCFVLTGKSGVGKSNFFLALGEELKRSDQDICVLMYDGAHLKTTPSITEVISQDFNDRVNLVDRRITEIWREIDQGGGMDERQVVLYVDAINENPQAKELLRQLDELVQKPWPWLKIVFSSRPETWQAIKRGVRLTETLYYREEGSETLGVELEPFSYSEQMDPFSRQELPMAYAKYRQVFNLQTEYEALPSNLGEMLCDPLSLWLVARTYTKQTIPPTLKMTELIDQYVNTLLRSERLYEEDRRLLEKQLVPLMVQEGRYSNAITIADIDAAGGELYEAIYSEQLLSDGRRVNQSFTNLLDADILAKHGEGREQKIAFKYERFYEYFVGRRIYELSRNKTDRSDFFKELIGQVNAVPFLWGAVKNALIQEMKEHNHSTVISLCFTEQQRVKEMMVSVLGDFGRDYPAEVEEVLKHLLPPEEIMGRLQSIRQLLGRIEVNSEPLTRNAKKIAIEVASNLGISWVLQIGAVQPDLTIRVVAVRYIYYLWQHDPKVGFDILEHLAQTAAPGLIPNPTAFEVVFSLSLIILCDYSQDKEVLGRLHDIWREMIARILGIRELGSNWKKRIREYFVELVISSLIKVIFRLFDEMPKYTAVNYPDVEAFFELGAKEKAFYKHLTQYLDVDGNYSREQMENDLLAVLAVRNLLIENVANYVLSAHTFNAPPNFFPFLKKFFEEAQKDQPIPNRNLWHVPFCLYTTT